MPRTRRAPRDVPAAAAAEFAGGSAAVADAGLDAGIGDEPTSPRRGRGLSGRAAVRLTGVATVLLWLLVAAGAAGGVGAWLARPDGSAVAPAVAVRSAAGPSGWAQAFVTVFLGAGEGEEERLRLFFPGVSRLDGVTAGARYAAHTAVLAAVEAAPGYWVVTVGVDEWTRAAGGGGFAAAGWACYRVSVAARGDAAAGGAGPAGAPVGYSATRLPDRTACPPALEGSPRLAYGPAQPDLGDPVSDVVRRFLAAMLAGEGDIARYTTPGAAIRPVLPAPYGAVELVGLARDTPAAAGRATAALADGEQLAVLATVRVAGPAGVQMMAYPLELAARAGRWEVAAVVGAPPLAGSRLPAVPAPTPPSAPTPLPTPSSAPAAGSPSSAGDPPPGGAGSEPSDPPGTVLATSSASLATPSASPASPTAAPAGPGLPPPS